MNVEDLESLWSSTEPIDLLRFYNEIQTVTDLIRFSRSRPPPHISLRTLRFTGVDKIVVVVPTRSAVGRTANYIANVFSPLPIVFVESAGRYFNYSKSVNAGVKEALTGDPDWVVVANDDMVEVDPARKLVEQINKNWDADCLLARPNITGRPLVHTVPCSVTRSIVPWDWIIAFTDALTYGEFPPFSVSIPYYLRKYGVRHSFRSPVDIEGFSSVKELVRKERFYYFRKIRQGPYNLLESCCRSFLNAGDFGVYRSSVFRKHMYDEVFINGYEDMDFSFLLSCRNYDIRVMDFQIESGGGSIAPTSRLRRLHEIRQVLNISYFFYKNRNELHSYD
jgi:hypothetical protein